MLRYLVFDTETTHLVERKKSATDPVQPHLVQLGAGLFHESGVLLSMLDVIIRPEGYEIAPPIKPGHLSIEECKAQKIKLNASDIHGITQEIAMEKGISADVALDLFNSLANHADVAVAHNADFDILALEAAMYRRDKTDLIPVQRVCTMRSTTELCRLEPFRYGTFKWPTLSELHTHLFGEDFEGAHNAFDDVLACAHSFFELKARGFDAWQTI